MSNMKMYSPVGTQDFMWFVGNQDGTFVTEFNEAGEKLDFIRLDKSQVLNYGITGIGLKLFTNIESRIFSILNKAVEVKLNVGGQDLIKKAEKVYLTKPYKHAVNTAVMSTNTKLQQFYDMNSNIAEYEFGLALEVDSLQLQITCHLVKDKHLYIQVRGKSLEGEVKGDLTFSVNGEVKASYETELNSEGWQELNWIFEG